jgi:glycosyltransferase involved in cell wall biosynthesis
LAFRAFDTRNFDVVISSASFAAKGIARRPETLHICYCYTPPRFLWGMTPATDRRHMSLPVRVIDALLRPLLQRWDRWAAAQPHHLVAISRTVAERIQRIYGVEATVIYPPVATERFRSQPCRDEGYYVYVGRLEAHKQVDLAIAAAQEAQAPLRVIGDGPLRNRLTRNAPPNVSILGWLPDQELIAQVAGCRALLFPGEEDFGIVMVEALSAGKPVIAYGAGGATEIVQPGVNGVLVEEQSRDAFAQALRHFNPDAFSDDACRASAAQFDERVFAENIGSFVEQKWTEFGQKLHTNRLI